MERRPPGKLEAILAAGSMLLATWIMIPPDEQRWLKLRALSLAHRAAGRAALLEGRRGMGDELTGRNHHRYELAYQLSTLRDRLGRALEGMRP